MSFYTNDTDALRQAISQSLPQMFSSIMSVIAAFVAMLLISVPLAFFVLAFALLLIVVIQRLTSASGRYFVRQQKELGDVNGFIEEAINGQKVIKVFTHEDATQKTFDQKNDDLYQASSQANYFGNITMPVVGNMGYLLYVLVAIVGAGAVLGGFRNVSLTGSAALTLGGIVSFLTLSRSFINPIGQISNQFAFVMMALAGASRIFDFLDQAPETNSGTVTLIKAHVAEDGTITQAAHHTDKWAWRVPANVQIEKGVGAVTKTGATTRLAGWRAASVAALAGKTSRTAAGAYTLLRGDIRFKDVNFSYERGHQILHDISLYAKPGQKVALVGATGAGKTTITNLINRFYDIDSGSILYDGINIRDINKKDLRQSLGIVLQDVNLFTGTVMDNIRYGKLDATDDECISAAKLANADGFIRMLPHGYDTVLQGDGSGLSQGQRQLISIARAAVADPPVFRRLYGFSGHRPRGRGRPPGHDPGRGHFLHRYPHRANRPSRHGRPHGRPHGLRDRPPPVHHPQLRCDHGHGPRPHHRARHTRPAAGTEGRVLPALYRRLRAGVIQSDRTAPALPLSPCMRCEGCLIL